CDALGDAPDFHFLPVGNAGNITAYWKGYREYQVAGKSDTLPRMFGWQAAGAAAKESDGRIDKVTDEEILTAYKLLARTEGIFVEPACAAPLAGLIKCLKAGMIPDGSLVAATMTG